MADPGRAGVIPEEGRARHSRRNLLEQLQPFPTYAVFKQRETGGVAARPRQTLDEPAPNWVGDQREDNWDRAGRPLQRPQRCAADC